MYHVSETLENLAAMFDHSVDPRRDLTILVDALRKIAQQIRDAERKEDECPEPTTKSRA
jgi:hypothetical protein